MSSVRGSLSTLLARALIAVFVVTATAAGSAVVSSGVLAAVVNSVQVQGNQRVDADTIRSYVTVKPGQNFTSFDTDESLRQLFATGLFSDVRIVRSGAALIVEVEENPIINLVRFVGNDKVKDEQLKTIVQSQSLGIFSQEKLDSDVERVREAVRRSGRASASVNANVETLDNNRVNIVFNINEGERTRITAINFVGNNAFRDSRLQEVISHNESNFLSWLSRDDVFDSDRLRADEERLRRFYFNRGYADFRVLSAVGDYNAATNSYTITITVDEGERYTFGNIQIDNALPSVSPAILQGALEVEPGDTYNASKVEKTLVSMTEAIAESGFAFGEVTPQGDRDFQNRTINLTFFVDEGPRTYIERIEVRGNTRTREYVIRREFDIAEGDAYNRVLVDKAKRRLDALGFFERTRISTRQGSAPDRVVVVVNVEDKPTGEISFGGGFSSTDGPIGEVSISEKNFLGRGQFVKASGGFGQDTTKYEISFTEPYFLGQRIAAGFDLRKETTDPDVDDGINYSSDTFYGRLRASAPITDELTLGLNYTFIKEEVSTDNVNSAAFVDPFNNDTHITSSVGYSLTYADLDSFKNPREGLYGVFTQDFAGVGGDAQYVKTEGRLTSYTLLSEDADLVFVGAVRAGYIYNFNDNLRFTDHFFKGGESIRGFADVRGYGPRNLVTSEALGGTTYANVTAEVQFPLPVLPRAYGLRGAVFVDAGTLFDSEAVLPDGTTAGQTAAVVADDSSIRASVGASILWDSPFGPLRADVSHAFQKEEADKTQIFRFGVSTKF
ncbi:MAG: outer membrane protein assembly factor BamA [Ahrensia sp.]|nr:outer membrane protein assembly factor BamA [Ahrensia sp.]